MSRSLTQQNPHQGSPRPRVSAWACPQCGGAEAPPPPGRWDSHQPAGAGRRRRGGADFALDGRWADPLWRGPRPRGLQADSRRAKQQHWAGRDRDRSSDSSARQPPPGGGGASAAVRRPSGSTASYPAPTMPPAPLIPTLAQSWSRTTYRRQQRREVLAAAAAAARQHAAADATCPVCGGTCGTAVPDRRGGRQRAPHRRPRQPARHGRRAAGALGPAALADCAAPPRLPHTPAAEGTHLLSPSLLLACPSPRPQEFATDRVIVSFKPDVVVAMAAKEEGLQFQKPAGLQVRRRTRPRLAAAARHSRCQAHCHPLADTQLLGRAVLCVLCRALWCTRSSMTRVWSRRSSSCRTTRVLVFFCRRERPCPLTCCLPTWAWCPPAGGTALALTRGVCSACPLCSRGPCRARLQGQGAVDAAQRPQLLSGGWAEMGGRPSVP